MNFQWRMNEVMLQNSSSVLIRSNGELILSDLRFQDAGNYTCLVQGTFQDTSSTAVLRVVDPLVPPPRLLSRPVILSPTPSLQFVEEGGAAQFICHVDGVPPPDVVWLKEGVALEVEPGVEVFQSQVVFICNATIAHQGMYTCVASNSEGNASEAFDLTIAGGWLK